MGEIEMKRRNEEKVYKNNHIWHLLKECFFESNYSYPHFFIPVQHTQKASED